MWSMFAVAASAQDVRFDGQLFRPSAVSEEMLWVEDTHVAPNGYGTARAYAEGALDPVRWTGEDGTTERLVSGLVGTDLTGAWWWDGLRLGATLPLYAYTGGQLEADQPGVGDLSLELGARLVDRDTAPVGVALLSRLLLPTASVEVPLGSTGLGWELTGIVDRRVGPVLLAANLGTRGIPRVAFEDMVWNDQVFGRFGAGYAWREGLGTSLELSMQTNWSSGQNPAGTAAELMGGGWARIHHDLVLRGGLSAGLSRSPGAPVTRLVAGIGWEPDPYPDRDADGIVDRDDWCPDEPEDPDGFEDADGCLDPSTTVRLATVAPDGSPVEAAIELRGPESADVAPGHPFATLHPGAYQATVKADGFVTWTGEVQVSDEQGATVTIPLVAESGTLRVWAVDATGAPVAASVSVSGGATVAADGEPMEVSAGEHALVVTAPGYAAKAMSIDVPYGQSREVPVVLARGDDQASAQALPEPDLRVGSR